MKPDREQHLFPQASPDDIAGMVNLIDHTYPWRTRARRHYYVFFMSLHTRWGDVDFYVN